MGKSNFYSFDQKKVSVFQVMYYQPTRKILLTYLIYNNSHDYCRNTLTYNICHRLDIYRLLLNARPLLLVNISSKFFTIIDYLRFPHSSSMNVSLGESSKFPTSSTSISSRFSSAITTFFEGLPSLMKPWFLFWKIKQVSICKRSLLDFI